MIRVTVDSSGLESSYKEKLAEAPKEAKRAFARMLQDTERHAQMVVSKQISEIYTIRAADVKQPRTASASLKSDGVATALVYRGRTLTLHHFKYKGGKRGRFKDWAAYDISSRKHVFGARLTKKGTPMKASVKKAGGLKPAGDRAFIGGTGAKSASKVQSIPFWRVGKERKPIKAIHGPSVPQMVLNEDEVVPPVLEDLGPYMQDRFEHHFNFYSRKG